ncbi:MAG: 2-oxoglutarate and iron-dependent oxygenase domain-containing protein [Geminicoccaceae bacterium]
MAVITTGNGLRAALDSGLSARQVPFTEIPIVDFAPMFEPDLAARQAVGDAVRDACTRVGFFYARNHRVPQQVIDATFEAAHRFFDLPLDQKLAVDIANSHNLRGYTKLLGENTDPTARGDLHEGFDLALDLPPTDPDVQAGVFGYGPNQWPSDLPGFREALLAYHAAMIGFGRKIFGAFAIALDLDEGYFEPFITKPMAHMRVLHYPSQDGPIDERQIGIGAHSDYECFTILCTDDVPALQVLNTAGHWIAAPPISGCFIVNVGDLMARWTNDYFASTVHRAINRSGRRRYSIPFFFGTNSQATIEVLPTCVDKDRPARYPATTTGDYICSRFDDTYAHRQPEAAAP